MKLNKVIISKQYQYVGLILTNQEKREAVLVFRDMNDYFIIGNKEVVGYDENNAAYGEFTKYTNELTNTFEIVRNIDNCNYNIFPQSQLKKAK